MIIDYDETELIRFALNGLTQKQCKEIYKNLWPDEQIDNIDDFKQELEEKLKAEAKVWLDSGLNLVHLHTNLYKLGEQYTSSLGVITPFFTEEHINSNKKWSGLVN